LWGGGGRSCVPRDVKSYSMGFLHVEKVLEHKSPPWSPKCSAVGSSLL